MQPDGHLVGHGTRWHEHGGFLAQQFCDLRLQAFYRGIGINNVVVYFCLRHGLTHGLAWAGYRIAAQINHGEPR